MPLPTANVEAQAFGYARCASDSTLEAWNDEIYGDCKCAKQHDMRAMFYWWGVDVMSRTPQEGSDCNCGKCVTDEFACEVIRLLNPGCIVCGCGSPDDVPESCDVTPTLTVYQTADASEQTILPNVAGRTTLIVSDTTGAPDQWASHVGQIATDDGAGVFTYSTPPAGTIILSSIDQVLWVAFTGGAGWYYPSIQGSVVSGSVTLISAAPQVTLLYARTIVVELTTDGTTWTPFYSGPETIMASGYTAPFSPDPIQARTTYFFGSELQCASDPVLGSIPPDACAVARTIAYGADSSEQGTLPNTLGIEYLIISDDTGSGNAWAAQVGDIATGDGVGGWTYTTPADLSTTRTTLDFFGGTNVIWLTSGGGTITPYFPPLLASVLYDTATITTDWTPNGHNIIARTATIQTSNDGGATWLTAFTGAETALGATLDITIVPGAAPLMRVLYGGLCPGLGPVTVSIVPARSLRLAADAEVYYKSPIVGQTVPMRALTFSFGSYFKAAGDLTATAFKMEFKVSNANGNIVSGVPAPPPPPAPQNPYYPIVISLVKDDTDARWLGNDNFILLCTCQSNNHVAYARAFEVPGFQALLQDGNWHSLDIVRSTSVPNRFDLFDWKFYVDGLLIGITEIYNVGTVDILNIPGNYVPVSGNFGPNLSATGLTSGRDFLWKNTYWCTGALTQPQITNVARTGAWQGAAVGLQMMLGYDIPATCDWVTGAASVPYMGERFNPAIANSPAGGALITGATPMGRKNASGTAVFVNDVPSTLLFP